MNYINLLDVIYPIGSLYFSTNTVSPSQIIGGVWVMIPHNRFLLASNLESSAKQEGGQSSFSITVNNLPSHSHSQRVEWENTVPQGRYCLNANGYRVLASTSSDNSRAGVGVDMGRNTGTTGGGQAITFWPPYYRIYIWTRIA